MVKDRSFRNGVAIGIFFVLGVWFSVLILVTTCNTTSEQPNNSDLGPAWPKGLQPGMAIQEVQKHVPLTLVKKYKGFNVYTAPVASFNTDGFSLIRSEVLINSTDSTLVSLRMWFNPLLYEPGTLSLEAYARYKYGKSEQYNYNNTLYQRVFSNYTVYVGRRYQNLETNSYNTFSTPYGWASGFFYMEGIIFDISKLDWYMLEWKADKVRIEQVLDSCGNLDL